MRVAALRGSIPMSMCGLFASLALVATTISGEAIGTADGPDHYRVRGVASGRHLALRALASASSPQIARIPADAVCLRRLGCQGGLTFAEFTTLSDEDKRRQTAAHPCGCNVEDKGNVGWVRGSYLAEDACSPSTAPGPSR